MHERLKMRELDNIYNNIWEIDIIDLKVWNIIWQYESEKNLSSVKSIGFHIFSEFRSICVHPLFSTSISNTASFSVNWDFYFLLRPFKSLDPIATWKSANWRANITILAGNYLLVSHLISPLSLAGNFLLCYLFKACSL